MSSRRGSKDAAKPRRRRQNELNGSNRGRSLMAKSRRPIAAVTLAALMLASCGGGDGGTLGGGPVTVTPTPSPTPTPACALASRQSFAKAVIDEWYLFPGDVASANPGAYGDVQSYIDALVDRKSTLLNSSH